MSIEIDYNFENPDKEPDEQKEVRTNFRITRCCANCKFYVPKSSFSNRGYCLFPNPEEKHLNKRMGESWSKEEMKTWSRTHSTMLCDLYQTKNKRYHFDLIAEWIDKEVNIDGTVKEK